MSSLVYSRLLAIKENSFGREIYVISPPCDVDFIKVEEVLRSGLVSLFQLRLKNIPEYTVEEVALRCQEICRKYDVSFILNDYINLVEKHHFDGVHLGKDDLPILQARQILVNNAIVGATCYNSLDLASKAVTDGASYVAFGSFFKSSTKNTGIIAEIDTIKKFKAEYPEAKTCAIGGITAENCRDLTDADIIAISGTVWK